jgi:lysophospholipase L1-like esterase
VTQFPPDMSETTSILCYGDSNTWGLDPGTGRRYDAATRWTGVLQAELGASFRIIDEGLNARTTIFTDPLAEYRNGKQMLIPCLETHKPLDIVVLMLGTNDLKYKFSATAYDIARGAATLVDIAQRSRTGPNDGAPRVLLVAPAPVGRLSEFAEMFEDAVPKSLRLASYYQAVAAELGCDFFDAGMVIRSSDLDGIHLDRDAHGALGKAVAGCVRSMEESGE